MSVIIAIMMVIGMVPSIALPAFAADGDVEAKWGESATSLTNSGTLAAAIDAAEADSSIKYIQLQSDVTSTSSNFIIQSGEFTVDLNGKNVSSGGYTFDVRYSGTKVTFVDSAENDGKVSSTGETNSAVIIWLGASVIIDGGEYEGARAVKVDDSSSSATINGGTFTGGSDWRAVINEGTLIITGGSFEGEGICSSVSAGSSSVKTTIKGGSFTEGSRGTIEYYGGLLDLSEYSDVEGISVRNWAGTIAPSDTTIKLPSGYCFYDSENNAVASLAAGAKYTIGAVQTGGNTDGGNTVEAKWGESATSLTNSGTLAAAIDAAEANSGIKYIQLQSDVTSTSSNIIQSGEFTVDLNGKNVSSGSYTFDVRNSGTKVMFVDSAENDGKVSTTETASSAVIISFGASVIIDGGEYEGDRAVAVNDSSSSATINGGTFTGGSTWRPVNNNGTLIITGGSFEGEGIWSSVFASNLSVKTTIKGGSFTEGSYGTIEYWGGLLDLSEYSDVEGISVYNSSGAAVTPSDTTIKLPSGYCFYDSENNAVASLAIDTKYTIGAVQTGGNTDGGNTVEAKWGESVTSLTNSGTLAAAIDAAEADSSIKYIQLQSDVTSTSSNIIQSGEFTVDLNGKNVSSGGYTFDVRYSGTKVTFVDSAENDGKVSSTGETNSAVIIWLGASVIIDGGEYESAMAVKVDDSSSSATINGGTFTGGSDWRAVRNEGTLIITGGSFEGEGICSSVSAGSSSVKTTIKGGSFTEGDYGTIEYFGGVLDLSGYSDVEGISVFNWARTIAPSDTTIKLPSGYCFYDSENNAVASLAIDTKYTIGAVQTGGNTDGDTPVAWNDTDNDGVIDEDETTYSTLHEALNAGGDVKLAKDYDASDESDIDIDYEADVTLDLNGKAVTSDANYLLDIYNASVTIKDSSEDNKGSLTTTGYNAIYCNEDSPKLTIEGGSFTSSDDAVYVADGEVTISGGSFTGGDGAVYVVDGEVTISGGSFTGGDGAVYVAWGGEVTISGGSFTSDYSAVYVEGGEVTISGGSFTGGDYGTFAYEGGVLDLSEYSDVEDISVLNWAGTIAPSDTTIKLPEGYAFSDGESATTVLEHGKLYTIGKAPETGYTISFASNGGTGSMSNGISYDGNYMLPENGFTAPYGKEFKAWLIGETEYAPGDVITVSGDTAATAVWKNAVAKITVNLTDAYGDGWNGNAVEVYVGEELIKSFTMGEGDRSFSASMNYDATKTYVFKWVKGEYSNECSFVINVNGESVFTADKDDCEDYENGATLYTLNPKIELLGASITVGQDLTMNYFVKVLDTEIDVTKLSMRFTRNGKSVTVDAVAGDAEGEYKFSYENIAPQCMGDLIDAELLLDGAIIALKEGYSVKENAQKLLETYSDDEKLVQLVTDMLTYGAAAQAYRGYNTDALVTDGVNGMVAPSTTAPTATDKALTTSTSDTVYFTSAGVWFDNVNKIYVKLSTVDGVTMKVNGEDVELDGTVYYTEAIYAVDFDAKYTFELYEGGNLVQTLTYSIKSYVYSMVNGGTTNDDMIALAKALYAYGKSAEAYKGGDSKQDVIITGNPEVATQYEFGDKVDVSTLFIIDENAGEATYAITGGTGEGSIVDGMFSNTLNGTFDITVTTAETDTHKAGSCTVTITVVKPSNSGETDGVWVTIG